MTAISRFLGVSIPVILFGQQAPLPKPNIPLIQTEPTDSQERVRRDARGKLFNFSGQVLPLTLGTNEEYRHEAIATAGPLPELPISESDTIVAGQVTELKVFLSLNGKTLYTEYTFKVESAMKPKAGITAGGEIVILRLGGVARVPSGGIIRYEIKGYGPEPVVGSRYLMFLKASPPPTGSYGIMKFWNVEGDIITAAFEDDVARAKEARSFMNTRALSYVISIINAAR